MINPLVILLSLLCLSVTLQAANFEENTNNGIRLQQQDAQILLDVQAKLPITPTMETALMHGIPLEYTLEAVIKDPNRFSWLSPISRQKIRVRLSYDLLKQTYLLTNLSLQRVTTDRDLTRSLLSLGNLQAFPLVKVDELETGKIYQILVMVKLEPSGLPNALRLATLFDEEWLIQSPTLFRYWTAP